MIAAVLVSNVVTLDPKCAYMVLGLQTEVLYTYHRTRVNNRVVWIFIDQVQGWYEKSFFKPHDLCYN